MPTTPSQRVGASLLMRPIFPLGRHHRRSNVVKFTFGSPIRPQGVLNMSNGAVITLQMPLEGAFSRADRH